MSQRRPIRSMPGGKRYRIVCADRHAPRILGTVVDDQYGRTGTVFVEDVELARTPASSDHKIGEVVSRNVPATARTRVDGGTTHVFRCPACKRMAKPVAVRSGNLLALVAKFTLLEESGVLDVNDQTAERHIPLRTLRQIMAVLRSI